VPAFTISIDLSHLVPGGPISVFPHLALAVQAIADRCEGRWKEYAAGQRPLPNGKRINPRSGEYLRSIMQRRTGDYAAEVYSELPYAQQIEEGAPRRDLKHILSSSLKVRTNARGGRYLIIPFRHSHPGNVMRDNPMPESVRDWWADQASSAVMSTYRRPSGTGALDIKTRQLLTVAGFRYRWGSRLAAADLQAMGITGRSAQRMEGMVNFRRPGHTGGAAHSQYITFRTMTEHSKGWIAPAQAGEWPARTTAETYKPVAEKLFARAVEADILAAMPPTP
jgi:hypothetical protein